MSLPLVIGVSAVAYLAFVTVIALALRRAAIRRRQSEAPPDSSIVVNAPAVSIGAPTPPDPFPARITTELAITPHPESVDSRWQSFAPEALDSLAEQLPGLPVTVDFTGPPVGEVLSARRTPDGVELTMSAETHIAGYLEGLTAGPGFNVDELEGGVVKKATIGVVGLSRDSSSS